MGTGPLMPRIRRELIRAWLASHDWSITRLARECSALTEDTISEGAMRNVVNGIASTRIGRIKLICRVTAEHGDGIAYEELIIRVSSQKSQ